MSWAAVPRRDLSPARTQPSCRDTVRREILFPRVLKRKEEDMSQNQIWLKFDSKTPFAGGKSFGNVGSYERLLGMVSFAIDPREKDLPFICDLEFAPRNADGLVEFKAVLDIVKPVDLSRGNRKLLFDFSNRGGRGAFTRLNDGRGADFTKERYAGNG